MRFALRGRSIIVGATVVVPCVFWPFGEQVFGLPKLIAVTSTSLTAAAVIAPILFRAPVARVARLQNAWLPLVFVANVVVATLVAEASLQTVIGERYQLQGAWALIVYVGGWFLGFLLFARSVHRRWLAEGIAIGGSLVALYAFVQVLGLDPIWTGLLGGRATSSIGQPNSMAAYLAMALPFPLALASNAQPFRRRAVWIGSFVLTLIGCFLGGSRGATLGLVCGGVACVALAFASHRGRRHTLRPQMAARRLLVATAVTSLVVGLVWLSRDLAPTRAALRAVGAGGALADESTQQHFELWRIGSRMVADHPFIGIGPERFPLVFPRYRDAMLSPDRREVYLPYRVESPHNVYLALAVALGVPGALVYVAIVTIGIGSAWRAARGANRFGAEAAVLVAILAASVIHAVTDAFMTAEVTSSWVGWLLLGIATRAGISVGRRTTLAV